MATLVLLTLTALYRYFCPSTSQSGARIETKRQSFTICTKFFTISYSTFEPKRRNKVRRLTPLTEALNTVYEKFAFLDRNHRLSQKQVKRYYGPPMGSYR